MHLPGEKKRLTLSDKRKETGIHGSRYRHLTWNINLFREQSGRAHIQGPFDILRMFVVSIEPNQFSDSPGSITGFCKPCGNHFGGSGAE